jgi:predicted dehydrogenase
LDPRSAEVDMPLRSLPRIAVIGTGEIATNFHLPSLRKLARDGRCVLAAVCDLDRRAAARAARAFGAKRSYGDALAMLDAEKPDGVVVLVPIAATAAVAGAVLRRGYPTLLEKPPGASSAQCRQLIRDARAGKARDCVSFNRRFCPVLVQGKREILKFGATKGASARMVRTRRTEPDFLFGTGIHSLDALRYLAGDIERVDTDRRTLAGDEQPSFTVTIGYRSGAAGSLCVRPEGGVQLERYELFGNGAVATINAGVGWLVDKPGNCTVYHDNRRVKLPDPLAPYAGFRKDLLDAATGGFYGAEAAFVDSLHRDTRFSPSLEESLPTVEIAEAIQAGRNWRRRIP